jgi:hypothetical protein
MRYSSKLLPFVVPAAYLRNGTAALESAFSKPSLWNCEKGVSFLHFDGE